MALQEKERERERCGYLYRITCLRSLAGAIRNLFHCLLFADSCVHKQGKEINKSRSLSRISQQLKIVATLSCRFANRTVETFRGHKEIAEKFCTKAWNLTLIIFKSFFNSRGTFEKFFIFCLQQNHLI